MSTDRKEIEERLIPGLAREGITDVKLHIDPSTEYINEIEVNDPAFKVAVMPPLVFAEKVRPMVNRPADINLIGVAMAMPGHVDRMLSESDSIHRVSRTHGQAVVVNISETMLDSLADAYLQAKLNQDSPERLGEAKANTNYFSTPSLFDRATHDDPEFIVNSAGTFIVQAPRSNGTMSQIQFPAVNMRDLAELKKQIMTRPSGDSFSMGFASEVGGHIKLVRGCMKHGVTPLPTSEIRVGWMGSDQTFISATATGDEKYMIDHTGVTFKLKDNKLDLSREGQTFDL